MKMFAMKSAAAAMILGWARPRPGRHLRSIPPPKRRQKPLSRRSRRMTRMRLLVVFGPEAADLMASGDAERDAEARQEFLDGYRQFHALDDLSEDKRELVIGRDALAVPGSAGQRRRAAGRSIPTRRATRSCRAGSG